MKRKRFSVKPIVGALKKHEAGNKILDIIRRHGCRAGVFRRKLKQGGIEEATEVIKLRQHKARIRELRQLSMKAHLNSTEPKDLFPKNRLNYNKQRNIHLARGLNPG